MVLNTSYKSSLPVKPIEVRNNSNFFRPIQIVNLLLLLLVLASQGTKHAAKTKAVEDLVDAETAQEIVNESSETESAQLWIWLAISLELLRYVHLPDVRPDPALRSARGRRQRESGTEAQPGVPREG